MTTMSFYLSPCLLLNGVCLLFQPPVKKRRADGDVANNIDGLFDCSSAVPSSVIFHFCHFFLNFILSVSCVQ